MFRLWSALEALHPTSRQSSEEERRSRDGASNAASLIQSLIPELTLTTQVDLVFSHSIAEPAGAVDWYERFAGAFDCELGKAIDIIDALENAGSRLLWDDVVVAAKDRRWAVWVSPNDVIKTKPGR